MQGGGWDRIAAMTRMLGPTLSATAEPLMETLGGDLARAGMAIAAAGIRGVQLSATMKGLRPRELDQRARRDVAAALGRRGLMISGLDLMIRHNHWLDPARQDRAATAAIAAIDLAREWGGVPVCLSLPIQKLGDDLKQALVAAAEGRGITLAVHAESELEHLQKWIARVDHPCLRAALDPAALIPRGQSAVNAAIDLASVLAVARLDDHANGGIEMGRCMVGQGDLDVTAYKAALSVASSLRGLAIELRDTRDPAAALAAAANAWGVEMK